MNRTLRLGLIVPAALLFVGVAGCSGSSGKPTAQASASASASAHKGAGAVLPGEVTAGMSSSQAARLAKQARKLPGVSTTLYDAKAHELHVYFEPGVTAAQKARVTALISARKA